MRRYQKKYQKKIVTCKVSGVMYRDRQTNINTLKEGENLKLIKICGVRDKKTIKVITTDNREIGCLTPPTTKEVFEKVLNEQKCKIIKITGNTVKSVNIAIKVSKRGFVY